MTDRTQVTRIMALIRDIQHDPFAGTGKPERLRHFHGMVMSRRIDQEHRLVYVVVDDRTVVIQQARYHY
ncbi:hypothetical protein GCM10023147_02840 [Tsukamurella soli]|uniref:Endoribonuclease YoeB n=1 Tax=Tsukamurella soli TaxID=644556 RepID=A0ABP8J2G7_9ACTN